MTRTRTARFLSKESVRSLFYVTCLSHVVISKDEEKGNFIFSKDLTTDICLDLPQACNFI